MSIWGRRDSEPPAEGADESQSPAQAPAEPGVEAGPGPQAEEPAPAFWRAQGETPAPLGRSPADAPPLADAPPPAHGDVPDGPPAPAGRQAAPAPDDMVVLDGAAAAGEPALTGMAGDPAGTAGNQDQAGTAGPESVSATHEPAGPEPAGLEPAALGPATPEAGVPEAAAPGAAMTGAAGPVAEHAQPAGMPPQAAPAGVAAQQWSEILAAFVDDPRGSVKMAADAVGEAIDELVNSVRARERALESSWHGAEADTEQLRTALREYRMLWHQVRQLNPAGKAGA
jgi:hypothetical protein